MREDLVYASTDAVKSILVKLGIDPKSRDLSCQDIEYTSCKLEELEDYIELYAKQNTSIYEKRVLGCYFLECLNEHISINKQEHLAQNKVFELLFSDIDIHETEVDYWSNTAENENEKDWWFVTKPLLRNGHGIS